MPLNSEAFYKNERYKFDDKDKEESEFRDHATRVLAIQRQLAHKQPSRMAKRGFHAKVHACLLGTLTLRPDRPQLLRHGLSSERGAQQYNVLARFSNGIGTEAHDLKPDVRGIALKIFGVPESNTVSKPICVDWLMTNSPNPFGRDQQEYRRVHGNKCRLPAGLC